MFIDKDSIIIDGISIGQYLLEAKFGYHKQWASGSGRNMAMEVTGTFNIFPKITLSFRSLTKEELNIIAPILNSETQATTYYDPEYAKKTEIKTYTGDWEVVSKNMRRGEPFTCAVISRKRRVKL